MNKENYIVDKASGKAYTGFGDVALAEDERMKREGRIVLTAIERTMAFNQRRVEEHPSELTREEAYGGNNGK